MGKRENIKIIHLIEVLCPMIIHPIPFFCLVVPYQIEELCCVIPYPIEVLWAEKRDCLLMPVSLMEKDILDVGSMWGKWEYK